MKKFILLSFVLVLVSSSCSKTDNNAFSSALTPTVDPTLEYSKLIVGSWQLAEIGTVTTAISNTSSSNQGGCGSSESHSETIWTNPSENETLSYKTDGVFQKDTKSDAGCKGSYLLNNNIITIKADCAQIEPQQTISSLSKNVLVLVKTDADQMYLYKYQHQ